MKRTSNRTSKRRKTSMPGKQATRSSTRLAELSAQKSQETGLSAGRYRLRNTASRISRDPKNKSLQDPKVIQRKSGTAGPRQAAKRPLRAREIINEASLDTWLQRIEPTKPPTRPKGKPKETADIPSSVSRTSSASATTESSSSMPLTSAKTTSKVTSKNLVNHGVLVGYDKTHPDELHQGLMTRLVTKVPREPTQTLNVVIESLRQVISGIAGDSKEEFYPWLDGLRYQLDKSANLTFHPFIHQRYFKHQIQKCKGRNEHLLQRTVMMSIFQPYWLPSLFDFNVEGQWQHDENAGPFASTSQKGILTEPQKKLGLISRPKPDMTFAFSHETFMSLAEEARLPMDLRLAMMPDDSDQVFPFLFIEVKKGLNDIEEAKLKNLNSAARALYNIQRWFRSAESNNESQDWKASFLKIRVFTFAFNADSLVVRTHRAELESLSQENPLFFFEEMFSQHPYTRNQISTLFNNILNDYAAKDLQKSLDVMLQAVFKGLGVTRNLSYQMREQITCAGENDGYDFDDDDYHLYTNTNAINNGDENDEVGFRTRFTGENANIHIKRKVPQQTGGERGKKRKKS